MKNILSNFRKIATAFGVLCLVLVAASPARAQLDAAQTYGGASGGTANAQTLVIGNVGSMNDLIGVPIWFLPQATNTGAMTLQVSNTNATLAATAVSRPSASIGPIALQGGEVRLGMMTGVMYDGTRFQLITHAGIVYKQTVVITGTTTYTPSAGLAWAKVTVIGGGGGGGGAGATSSTQLAAGSGGAAGAMGFRTLSAAQIGASQTVTIGAGGVGSAGSNGSAGTTSSFGSLCIANGGNGGTGGTANGGVLVVAGVTGATGSACDLNVPGSGSSYGFVSSNTTTNSASSYFPGNGGPGYLGGGLAGQTTSPPAASGYGAGGNASANSEGQAATAGGNGAPGVVFVEEWVYN